MGRIVPFGVLSACHGARHGEIAIALAAEFGAVDADHVDDGLDVVAVGLAAGRCGDPVTDLLAVGAHLDTVLAVDTTPGRHDLCDLLVPDVMTTGVGHELALAQAGAEAARRAGIDLGVVATSEHCYLAHREGADGIVISPRHEWRAMEAADLVESEGDMAWRCSHEVAYLVLSRILLRAERTGLLGMALTASQLRLKLPVEETLLARLRGEDKHLRSRLN